MIYLFYLKIKNPFAELMSLKSVWYSGVKAALRESEHLSTDTNTPFVKHWNGIFVSLSNFPEYIALWDFDIFKVYGASRWGPNTQLVFFFANTHTRSQFVNNEASDAFVSL